MNVPPPPTASQGQARAHGHALVAVEDGQVLWSTPSFDRWRQGLTAPAWDELGRTFRSALQQASGDGSVSAERFYLDVPRTSGGCGILVLLFPMVGQQAALWVLQDGPSSLAVDVEESRDTVTGLPDRRSLDARLDSLAGRPEPLSPWAILFVDLDGFKQINDRHGHLVGDQVLATVAQRLAGAIRERDFIARFGGDEFVVLVEGIDSAEKLAVLVKRLREAAQEGVETPVGRLSLSASVGMALSTEGFATPRDILAAADKRMYAAKRSTR